MQYNRSIKDCIILLDKVIQHKIVETEGIRETLQTYTKTKADEKWLLSLAGRKAVTTFFKYTLTLKYPIKDYYLKYSNIIFALIPNLEQCYQFNQNSIYHPHDVYEHILSVVDGCQSQSFDLRMAALLHDIGKPNMYTVGEDGRGHFYGHPVESAVITTELLNTRLSLPKSEQDGILNLVRYHDVILKATKPKIKSTMHKIGRDIYIKLLILKESDIDDHSDPEYLRKVNNLDKIYKLLPLITLEDTELKISDLAISGNDVKRILKIKQGPRVGRILQYLLEEVKAKELDNTIEALSSRVQCLHYDCII